MTILDRYLLVLFFKIFLICLISFIGLFMVIHMSTNLDELAEHGEEAGGTGKVVLDFYLPRALDIFDRTAGILILIAAIFSLGLIERRREMTAVQSAGIPKSRLVRPIIFASLLIIGISIVNREFWIPQVREDLVKTPRNWNDDGAVTFNVQKDPATGLLIRGGELFVKDKKIIQPDIQLPIYLHETIGKIGAEYATIEPANEMRPAGLYMHQVFVPEKIADVESIQFNDRTIVYTSKDHSWLRPRQCFIAVDVDAKEMAYGKQLARYATLPEMMESLRKPRMWFGHRQQVDVHARILRPFMDLTLLLLGLPLAIGRTGQNVFTSTGFCLLIVIVVQVSSVVFHSLGSLSLIKPAALSAWLPVLVFFPLAILAMRKLKS